MIKTKKEKGIEYETLHTNLAIDMFIDDDEQSVKKEEKKLNSPPTQLLEPYIYIYINYIITSSHYCGVGMHHA